MDQVFKKFIIQTLRRASYRWKPRTKALQKARIQRGFYTCASCKATFPKKQIELDHVQPIVNPKTGFTTWDDYINRMFCNEDGFQVLCKSCHSSKSDIENELRKIFKKRLIKIKKPVTI